MFYYRYMRITHRYNKRMIIIIMYNIYVAIFLRVNLYNHAYANSSAYIYRKNSRTLRLFFVLYASFRRTKIFFSSSYGRVKYIYKKNGLIYCIQSRILIRIFVSFKFNLSTVTRFGPIMKFLTFWFQIPPRNRCDYSEICKLFFSGPQRFFL